MQCVKGVRGSLSLKWFKFFILVLGAKLLNFKKLKSIQMTKYKERREYAQLCIMLTYVTNVLWYNFCLLIFIAMFI